MWVILFKCECTKSEYLNFIALNNQEAPILDITQNHKVEKIY